jgi:hypothetical protein
MVSGARENPAREHVTAAAAGARARECLACGGPGSCSHGAAPASGRQGTVLAQPTMRAIIALALLASVATTTKVGAQGAPWRPAPPQWEAVRPEFPLLDATGIGVLSRAPTSAARVEEPRDHLRGAQLGAQYGSVAGVVVALLVVCRGSDGEGNATSVCILGGAVVGALGGAVVGGVLGAPPRR